MTRNLSHSLKLLENELSSVNRQIEDTKSLIKQGEDPAVIELAKDELRDLEIRKENLKRQITNIQEKAKETNLPNQIIVEIRAGAGGEEAALFAAEILRMYLKYAEKQGWETTPLTSHPTTLGGFKEIIFKFKGQNVYPLMKCESGVHRVQRIPKTEKSGRIHTSTVTVAVLPEATPAEIKIDPGDIRIDVFRASGPGGQYVNRRESAVRVIHLPTGIMTTSQTARTQIQNRENALSILRTELLRRKREKEILERAAAVKKQIGKGERSEKIRTYNFPQDRVTDHRVKKSWHNIQRLLDGNLGPIVKALIKM